jgi:hypothetical protein
MILAFITIILYWLTLHTPTHLSAIKDQLSLANCCQNYVRNLKNSVTSL